MKTEVRQNYTSNNFIVKWLKYENDKLLRENMEKQNVPVFH